ncbi:MAG: DegT/DnrJ/EryC1/StrS family aminotransferase [bacterium]
MIPIAQPLIDKAEKDKVLEVLDSGMLASGEYVSEFEKKVAEFIGTRYGIATSSGTSALQVALKAAGIKKGDKVLTTPFTFIASSNSILYCEAEPVFVDVKKDTYNIDPEQIRKKLEQNPDIKALLIVHLYGLACDMDKIMDLVKKYNLVLIEDCAQAHGAEFEGQKAGSFGDVGIFSFYPSKNMTTGEGGIIVTSTPSIKDKARMFIDHGSNQKYNHEILGYNFRMTNIAAAIGIKQLEKLNKFNQIRRKNAAYFTEELKGIDQIEPPAYEENKKHVFNLYTMKVKNRDRMVASFEKNGIGYGIYYPEPIYRQTLYVSRGYNNLNLEVTETLCREVISIPVHPGLDSKDKKKIVEVIKNCSFS